MIKQARRGIQESIKINKSVITLQTPPPLVYNSIGELVKDTTKQWTSKTVTCRISYESKIIDSQINAPTGASTNLSRFILTDYRTPLIKGQRFDNYEVGVVYPLYFMGQIIGYQAPLKESNE